MSKVATKYRFSLGCGFVGATRTKEMTVEDLGYTQEEWEAMPKEHRDEELDDALIGWTSNYIEQGFEPIDGDE